LNGKAEDNSDAGNATEDFQESSEKFSFTDRDFEESPEEPEDEKDKELWRKFQV